MHISRIVEYVFFFGLLALAGYMVWQIMSPFLSALALAVIIVIICYPLYERIQRLIPRRNRTVSALLTTLIVVVVIVLPIVLISSLLVREVVNLYQTLGTGQELSIEGQLKNVEATIQQYLPGFELNVTEFIRQGAGWFTGNLGAIFAGTVSTVFVFLIALVGAFYFFRDGKELLAIIVKISPLPDKEDAVIFSRVTQAVRSVVTGTVLVALLQGILVAVGFTIFGIERAVLWGSIASVGALIPGVGTTIITAPAVAYLLFTGDVFNGIGLLAWGMMVVGTLDNFLAPYLMSRGNNLHPFIILISVLGGLSLFGPIGFIVGPVIVTLFMVLLEIYNQYIVKEQRARKRPQ